MAPELTLRKAEREERVSSGPVPEDPAGLEQLIEALNTFHEQHGLLSDDHSIL